jgi:glyoxylase-like metal-dependent hydrolase (beta-lactamase superfamily II)
MTALHLGEIRIDRIVEQQGPFVDAFEFFPSLTAELLDEHRAWLQPTYIDMAGRVVLCVQSYLVRTPRHTILIDSCVGNHKPRPSRPAWDRLASERYERGLAAAGIDLADVDVVMCTHLHVDHVGWNTRLENGRWVPTFPNARYLFARRELEFWTTLHADDPQSLPWIADSVLPVVAAGRAEPVTSDHQLDELVRLIPTPGHTIDHFSVLVGRPGSDALITGDMIHSPLQARFPELGMFRDHDAALAGRTRRRIFEQLCDAPTLLCTAHFPEPSVGRLRRRDAGYDVVITAG